MMYCVTYGKDGEFRDDLVAAENLTMALFQAEKSDWIVDGWEFIGVELVEEVRV
jgi:hypothetical protein